jgi:hypothetical protein
MALDVLNADSILKIGKIKIGKIKIGKIKK